MLRFGLTKEDNHTDNVDNSRLTFSVAGDQIVKERVRLHFGFDHRNFVDDLTDKSTNSNLVTVGAQVQVTEKLDVSIKREQNLGEADPTYPNQTTLAANYKVNQWTKIFLTERMASAAIMPIGDFSQTGFAGTNARRETALGVETRFGKYSSLVGRYQLENGAAGADSFAVFGMQNRLPITKGLSLEPVMSAASTWPAWERALTAQPSVSAGHQTIVSRLPRITSFAIAVAMGN